MNGKTESAIAVWSTSLMLEKLLLALIWSKILNHAKICSAKNVSTTFLSESKMKRCNTATSKMHMQSSNQSCLITSSSWTCAWREPRLGSKDSKTFYSCALVALTYVWTTLSLITQFATRFQRSRWNQWPSLTRRSTSTSLKESRKVFQRQWTLIQTSLCSLK